MSRRRRLFSALLASVILAPVVVATSASAVSTTYASDTFNRTVTGGWGTADTGGAWNAAGPAYAVSPGLATIQADSTTPTNFLDTVSATDVEVLSKISPPPISDAYVDAGIGLRYQASDGSFYQVSAYYAASSNGGNYTVELKRKPTNTQINPDLATAIPGGTPFWIRFQAQGVSPTALRWKMWADSSAEPASWTSAGTDSTAGLQTAGGVGVQAYASTGTPVVTFNSITATSIPVVPPPPPPPPFTCTSGAPACDTFTRVASGGWGSADVGGSWSIAGTAAKWSVSPGKGAINVAAGGAEIGTMLNGGGLLSNNSVQDVEVKQRVSLPLATGGTSDAFVLGRSTGGTTANHYRVGVVQGFDNTAVRIRVQRGDGTFIGSDTNTAIAPADGVTVWLRVQFQGVNPTAIRAKAWQDGMAEPSLWTVATTDSTPALQKAAAVGVRARNEDAGAAHTFVYSAFQALNLAARPAIGSGTDVDSFNRTVSSGWGSATTGGAWNTNGAGYAVTPGRATIQGTPATPTNFLTSKTIGNVDVLAWVSPPAMSLNYVDQGVTARYNVAGGTFYQLSAYFASSNNGGNYTVQLKRKPANTQITPDVNTSIPGGTALWLRLDAKGSNPTTLRWKVWQDGTPEPSAWMGTATDSTPAMQPAGGAGVEAYTNAGTTTVAFNSFLAGAAAP